METAGVTRISALIAAQSSIFSMIVRGSPSTGNRPNRVPPAVNAHDGSATRNSMATRGQRLDVYPAPGELPAEMRIVRLEGRQPCAIVFGDPVVAHAEVHRLLVPSPYRVNAVTLPASTLRMFPVDLPERSDAKKYTASATSSGYTLRFRRLRSR